MSPSKFESYPRVPREHLTPFTSIAHELPVGESLQSLREKLKINELIPAYNVHVTEANIDALKSRYQFARNIFTVGKTYVVFGRV